MISIRILCDGCGAVGATCLTNAKKTKHYGQTLDTLYGIAANAAWVRRDNTQKDIEIFCPECWVRERQRALRDAATRGQCVVCTDHSQAEVRVLEKEGLIPEWDEDLAEMRDCGDK